MSAARQVEVPVGDHLLHYSVDGETFVGDEQVMLDRDDDLLASTPWASAGYGIAPFLAPDDHVALVAGITSLVGEVVGRHVGQPDGPFTLERYHEVVTDDAVHREIVGELFAGGIPVADLPIPIERIEERASELCGARVATRCPDLDAAVVFVRIARPGATTDHNPPHRDVWLDHLRHAVNGYAPLAGSTSRSSLALVPGSHRWPESAIERTAAGARIGSVVYEVPAVTGVTTASREMRLVRPDPRPNELLLFSPYLIHGGGINLQADTTRASLELRFWRVGARP
ncbi:MAG: phytanoyl-CoA dioxygenase family protein [Acidimicrobiales bacterium]|nr:phytanoyl-CoA dioxygenase family protein [Acidimicrobiales bacterium]